MTTGDNQGIEQQFVVKSEELDTRLDVYVAGKMTELSRAQARRLVDEGQVSLNGETAKPSARVQSGDNVTVVIPPPKESQIAAEQIALEIVFEDADLLVINKPRGMVVHPATGAEDGTLVNALLGHGTEWSGIGGVARPGIVHRLDKDTTGLLMVAKNDPTHRALQEQIQARTAKRRYLALSWGRPPFEEAVIDLPIGRHPTDRTRMAVIKPTSNAQSREAVTEVRVRERFTPAQAFTLFECSLQTGRTHQIRVHLSYAGYPVVGDPVYNGLRKIDTQVISPAQAPHLATLIADLHGQALHAYALSFTHPRTGEPLSFTAEPPAEFEKLLAFLRTF